MEIHHYDGTKLINMKDVDGLDPDVYMAVSNRTAGKTTFFNNLIFKRARRAGKEFMLVFRKTYDLADLAGSFWSTLENFYPGYHMSEKSHKRGIVKSLWLHHGQDIPSCVGWGVSLSTIETLKRSSAMFKNVNNMFMDEFILEKENYLDNELDALMSLHTSVARGYGEMVRKVPLFLAGNPFTMINPYYSYFKIPERLRKDTKYLRGKRWVFEQSVNLDAMAAQKASGFNQAFASLNYAAYAAEGVYFNDNLSLVGKLDGRMRYVCTLVSDHKEYGVLESFAHRCIYVTDKADTSYPTRIAASAGDVTPTTMLFSGSNFMVSVLRSTFRSGLMRFKNLECKTVFLNAIKY